MFSSALPRSFQASTLPATGSGSSTSASAVVSGNFSARLSASATCWSRCAARSAMASTAVDGKAPPSGRAVSCRGGTASFTTRTSPTAGVWSTGLLRTVTVPPPGAPAPLRSYSLPSSQTSSLPSARRSSTFTCAGSRNLKPVGKAAVEPSPA